jgi:hypothetical protein
MPFRIVWFIATLASLTCPAFAQEPEPVITLRRTACYGTCPVYSLEIFENGFIRYVGTDFVQSEGEHRTVIHHEAVENLIALFLRSGYFSLKDDYETCRDADGTTWFITDLPTTYTSLRIGTKKKSVRNYACAPHPLIDLEHAIDKAANTQRWIGDPSDHGPYGSSAIKAPKP